MMESEDVDVSVVDSVEFPDNVAIRVRDIWLSEVRVLLLGNLEQSLPLLVYFGLVFLEALGVLDQQEALVGVFLLQGFLESLMINLLQDYLESIQGLLEDLVPMGFSHVADHWNEKREGVGLVGLEDSEEVIVLEIAHCSICHLKVEPSNAFHQPFEKLGNVGFQFRHLTSLQDLQQLCDVHHFLWRVSEWPIPQ